MKNYLGRMIVLVNDYEAAAKFYEKNFGFHRLFDTTSPEGERYLHLGTKGENVLGIWLMLATTEEQQQKVGHQTGGAPLMVIYTSDIIELYQQLIVNKVAISKKPMLGDSFRFLHCLDLYGNELVVVELN